MCGQTVSDVLDYSIVPTRQTCSGKEFSPWLLSPRVVAARASAFFDFSALLQAANLASIPSTKAVDARAASTPPTSPFTHPSLISRTCDLPGAESFASVALLQAANLAAMPSTKAVDARAVSTQPTSPFTDPSLISRTCDLPDAESFASVDSDVAFVTEQVPCEMATAQTLTQRPNSPDCASLIKGAIEIAYRKAKGKACNRLKQCQAKIAAPYGEYAVKPSIANKHFKTKPKTHLARLNALKFRHARTGYVGAQDTEGSGRVFSLKEMVDKGFEVVEWDGKDPMPILDCSKQVIGVCAGRPDDPSWDKTTQDAAKAIEKARGSSSFPDSAIYHHHGKFPALAVGASFGGGQMVAGDLINNAINAAILLSLVSNIALIRIASFASGAFAMWSPRLYAHYVDRLGRLYAWYPNLHRNFLNSVFACATFNFGPRTCTFDHVDSNNLPFGWCAITALGKFDYKCGGHLVLWDLKIAIEFPPGSTIIIPSGALCHANTQLQPADVRYSFTQYAAGGLFRWVDHGFQNEMAYTAGWSRVRKQQEDDANKQHWAESIDMFSTLEELHNLHM